MNTLVIFSTVVSIISGLAVTVGVVVGIVPKFRHKALTKVSRTLNYHLTKEE